MAWRDPWPAPDRLAAYIGAGAWRVRCACGEAPPTHPDWRLACCSGCGAIYEDVIFPKTAAAIEVILLKRPQPIQRNWRAPETVADLVAQNKAHGDPTA